MKYFILLIFSLSFFISGCNFLKGDKDGLTSEEESSEWEEGQEEDFVIEDDEEFDEEEFEMEEGEELDEDGEELDEKPKRKGFFSRLFGGLEDEEEEEADSEFIGEDEDFSPAERDYEDYEEESIEDESIEAPIAADQTENLEQTADQESADETAQTAVKEETVKQSIPLNKIISTPYRKAGQIVNAVYIARPDEDLAFISQKIYGRNEEEQLLKINTHLQNRPLSVGDKIYYNSPNRPNDQNQLLFYYQDNNISPSYYNLSTGDNIRQVAFQLLGHPKSWKEIWATNPNLKSKSTVENDMSIVYWTQPVSQPADSLRPTAEPVEAEQAEAETQVPTENLEELQSPTEEEIKEPLPAPAPPIQKEIKESKGIVKELLNNIEMIIGAIIILILLFLIFNLIMKKKKQRDFDYTATNIKP